MHVTTKKTMEERRKLFSQTKKRRKGQKNYTPPTPEEVAGDQVAKLYQNLWVDSRLESERYGGLFDISMITKILTIIKGKDAGLIADDLTPSKRAKGQVAEASRPGRPMREKYKSETRKPQGRKWTTANRPAQYADWLTPLLWPTIKKVGKQVGWEMNASEIAKGCIKENPSLYAGLTRETVRRWIERPLHGKPHWKDWVLERVDRGYDHGHHNGGARGIFVSNGLPNACISSLTAFRPGMRMSLTQSSNGSWR